MLNDPVWRAKAAKENVEASRPRDEEHDPRDVLSEFDRDIVGAKSVNIRLPLRDPQECRVHLGMLEETCRALRLNLEGKRTDRTHLFMVRGVLRELNQKLNAYRFPSKN